MKKLLFAIVLFVASFGCMAQNPDSLRMAKLSPEIRELTINRDKVKSELKAKTLENNKDISKMTKLQNDKSKFKEQIKTAKKAKKSDKAEAAETKLNETTAAIKELEMKIKADDKTLDQLDKDLKNAEKALKAAKERVVKEKAKGKK